MGRFLGHMKKKKKVGCGQTPEGAHFHQWYQASRAPAPGVQQKFRRLDISR